MNKKRIFASGIAAFCLTAALGGQAFAAGAGFSDLKGISGQDKIAALQEQGLIKGVTATEFRPQAALTNSEAVQLLANGISSIPAAAGTVKSDMKTVFSKVAEDAWYSKAFVDVTGQGIELAGDIDPSQTITREVYTNFLMDVIEKWANLPMVKLVPKEISDESQITPEYQGAIQRALAFGVTTLDAKGAFNPKGTITRADAAVMLYNALAFVDAHPFVQPEAGSASDLPAE